MAEARHVAGLPLVNTEISLVGQWHVKKRFNPRGALALALFFLRFFSIRSTIKQLNCSAEIGAFERDADVFRHAMLRVRKVSAVACASALSRRFPSISRGEGESTVYS